MLTSTAQSIVGMTGKGNPELRSLTVILKAMGMRLAVQSLQQRK